MTRIWFSVIAIGALAAACAQPNPPPAPTATAPTATAPTATTPTAAVVQPADAGTMPEGSTSSLSSGQVVGGMPPTVMNANPSGTPSYVIHPGDPAGRQVPRPGGAPAF